MRNIPLFTTDLGIASLDLEQIPYREEAYITIRDSQDPAAFLEECRSFCRAAGAERILAGGHPCCEAFPLYTAIFEMRLDLDCLEETDAALFPVTEETLDRWREIYNQKMAHVPGASYLTMQGCRKLAQEKEAYFVHRNGVLLGIGALDGDQILALASCSPGAGRTVIQALGHATGGDTIWLEAASSNEKAMALYETVGFIRTAELCQWYKIM